MFYSFLIQFSKLKNWRLPRDQLPTGETESMYLWCPLDARLVIKEQGDLRGSISWIGTCFVTGRRHAPAVPAQDAGASEVYTPHFTQECPHVNSRVHQGRTIGRQLSEIKRLLPSSSLAM